MRKIILTTALAAAALTASTANAQYREGYGNGNDYRHSQNYDGDQRLHQLQRRLDRSIERGTVSRWEGRDLRRQLADLYRLEDRLEDGGFNRWEREQFARQTYAFERRLAAARYSRGNGQNWNGNYDRRRSDDDND